MLILKSNLYILLNVYMKNIKILFRNINFNTDQL